MGSWSDWKKSSKGDFYTCKKVEGEWLHMLISIGSGDPRHNHTHEKVKLDNNSEWVWCSAVVNGRRVHSRREMIDAINIVASTSLKHK